MDKNNLNVIEQYIIEDFNTDPDSAVLAQYQYIYSDTRTKYKGIHSNYIKLNLTNVVIEHLIIPEGVTFIEADAFSGLNIKKVSFPSTLIEISPNAFLNCKMLKEIEFKNGFKQSSSNSYTFNPSEIKTIGNKAFKNTGLVNVILPEGITNLSYDVFVDCNDLESCNIPSKTTYLFSNFNNTKIKEIKLTDKLNQLGNDLFKGTLVKNIDILKNIKTINSDCFSNSNLEVINITGINKSIGRQINMPKLQEVNFSFTNKKKEIIDYSHKKEQNKQIVSFCANSDGYLFVNKAVRFNLDALLKKGEYVFYTKYGKNTIDSKTMASYLNVSVKKLEYALIDYTYGIGLPSLYKWIVAVEKRRKGKHEAFLPKVDIMKYLLDDEKLRIRYFVIEDKYKNLCEMFGKKVETKEFINFCYMLGLFSDIKEEHESAYDFLIKISNLNIQNYLNNFLNIDNYKMIDIKYDKKFAKFFKENFNDINSFKEGDTDFTRKIYLNFTNIYNSIKNNKKELTKEAVFRYLTENKYIYTPGNEMLATLASNYAELYDQKDFDRLQTIFELGKQVTKKIIQTKDIETNGITYLWSPSTNPINLFLGHKDKADCCARLNSSAESIMVNSITNSNVQNLILFDEHKNIIGKSTAYYNEEENYILFNNVEINRNYSSIENQKKILIAFKRAVNDQVLALESLKPLQKVHVGMKCNDLNDVLKKEYVVVKNPLELVDNFKYERYDGDANHASYGQAILHKRR